MLELLPPLRCSTRRVSAEASSSSSPCPHPLAWQRALPLAAPCLLLLYIFIPCHVIVLNYTGDKRCCSLTLFFNSRYYSSVLSSTAGSTQTRSPKALKGITAITFICRAVRLPASKIQSVVLIRLWLWNQVVFVTEIPPKTLTLLKDKHSQWSFRESGHKPKLTLSPWFLFIFSLPKYSSKQNSDSVGLTKSIWLRL